MIENQTVPVPGTLGTFDLRAQNPHGPFGGPLLSLVSGQYPAAANEIALTSGVAADFNLRIGSNWSVRRGWTWKKPASRRPREPATSSPGTLGEATNPISVTVLFDAPLRLSASTAKATAGLNIITAQTVANNNEINPETISVAAAVLGMLLIALVGIGGFTVLAQRRLRAIGMLADPVTGIAVITSNADGGHLISGHAGTSASAPLWAGIIALADQYAKRHLGFVNPAIYQIARSPQYRQAFHDITAGSSNTADFPPRRSPATEQARAGTRSPAGAAPTPRFSSRCSPGTPPHDSRMPGRSSGMKPGPIVARRSLGEPAGDRRSPQPEVKKPRAAPLDSVPAVGRLRPGHARTPTRAGRDPMNGGM